MARRDLMTHTMIRGPLPKPLVPSSEGLAIAAGFSIVAERGINQFRQTEILIDEDLSITLTDDAGVGQYGSVKFCTLPEGVILLPAVMLEGTLLLLDPFIATAAVEVGIGSTAPANGDALATTEKTVLSIASTASVALLNTFSGMATPNLFLDGRAAAKDLYLNFRVADNAAHATTPDNVLNGRIVLNWFPMTNE